MDVERIIDDIEQLQEMFEAPDIRPLSASDISAANRRHDEMLAHSPWFRLGSILACVAEPNPRHLGWAKSRANPRVTEDSFRPSQSSGSSLRKRS
jgi:hypothetical protein